MVEKKVKSVPKTKKAKGATSVQKQSEKRVIKLDASAKEHLGRLASVIVEAFKKEDFAEIYTKSKTYANTYERYDRLNRTVGGVLQKIVKGKTKDNGSDGVDGNPKKVKKNKPKATKSKKSKSAKQKNLALNSLSDDVAISNISSGENVTSDSELSTKSEAEF